MNKKRNLTNVALACALLWGVAGTTFVGCKDYDDDIKKLQEQVDANKSATTTEISSAISKQIGDLETKLNAAISNKADATTIANIQSDIAALQGLKSRIETLESKAGSYLTASALEGFLKEGDLAGYLKEDALAGYVKEGVLTDYLKEDALEKFLKDNSYLTKEDVGTIPTIDIVRGWLGTELNNIQTLMDNYNSTRDNVAKLPSLISDVNTLKSDLSTLKSSVEGLEGLLDKVSALEKRIQSLVFVPTYEGVHPLYYIAGNNNTRSYGAMEFLFRVSPAEAAEKIAADQTESAVLNLLCEGELISRAAAPLTIKEVKAENGILRVKALANTFGDKRPVALALKNGNDNVTSDYFVVEAAKIENNYIVPVGHTHQVNTPVYHYIAYTDDKIVNVTATHDVKASVLGGVEKVLVNFGFAKNLVITKINGLDVKATDAATKNKIQAYKTASKLELTETDGVISIKIKAAEVNKPGNVNNTDPSNYKFTIKDETTGCTADFIYSIGASSSESNVADYNLSVATDIAQNSSAKVIVWTDQNSNNEQVFTLVKERIGNITIPGITDLTAKLAVLEGATKKYQVMKDGWVDANQLTTPYLEIVGGVVKVTLPANAKWEGYNIRTVFTTDIYGVYMVDVNIPLSYPAEISSIASSRWVNGVFGTYYVTASKDPVKDTEFAIENDLRVAYINAAAMEAKGFKYSFELLNTLEPDPDGVFTKHPDGVDINGNYKLTFSQYVDLKDVSVKVKIMDAAGNVAFESAAFKVTLAYPVNGTFETISADALKFKKANILAGETFNPWATTTGAVLQLKDFRNNSLMTAAGSTIGFDAGWKKTYVIKDLKFDLASVQAGTIDPKNVEVNQTTGIITLKEKNLTQNVSIVVKVTATNKYGKSEQSYTIVLEKTL